MRIAIVHPWFLALGGAEQTVGAIAEMFPEADIFTIFYDRRVLPEQLAGRRIFASGWNWIPGKYHFYRYLLPLYPYAFEKIDLRGYDLVISSDSCLSKGILADDEATHVCYCHSPMRCLYDQYQESLEELPWLGRAIFSFVAQHLRMWDYIAAHRVNGFVANSRYISQRIRAFYGLDSEVVYPPVQIRSDFLEVPPEDFYLCVGRLVGSKRVDIAIEACNRLGRRLVVVGKGRELKNLKKLAGPTIEFTEWASRERLGDLYSRCRALLFASKEDFGIVPVECQSYGRPVIAYGRGGALESVIPGVTGVHFAEQTPASLIKAILELECHIGQFDPARIRAHAESFGLPEFKRHLRYFVDTCCEAKKRGVAWMEMRKERFAVASNREYEPLDGWDAHQPSVSKAEWMSTRSF